MKIKTKLTLGVGLLFILIVWLAFVGAKCINELKNDTENILEANYNTLEYARNMMLALDGTDTDAGALTRFAENLGRQQRNVTEAGEKEATARLAAHFEDLRTRPADRVLQRQIRKDLSDVMRLNMDAIRRKSDIAKETAASATLWIMLTGTVCFVIAFTLLVNLPGHIAGPIRQLSESIRQVAAKNYRQRVDFERHDEFGELAVSFNAMARKLEEYNDSNLYRLLFEKKRIETLINNMHDPVVGLDEYMNILFVNAEALKILDMETGELVGRCATDIAPRNDLLRLLIRDLVITPERTGNDRQQPVKIYADNKESYFEKEIIPIDITPSGETERRHIGHVIILKNITPFKELDVARTHFIATVSHELKTPISSIKMSLRLLEHAGVGRLGGEQRQLLDGIREDSDRLLKITGELLEMSQVETGNIQLNVQDSMPGLILQYALDAVRVPAEQKRVALHAEMDPAVPSVKADAEKTAWVLVNFLTNAIRYSPEQGRIDIRVRAEKKEVVFSVKDEGKGIEGRYREKIFDRYFQVPGGRPAGTGLGLAISREFIEAQGGRIGVESEVGMGSTFRFSLPVS